jgi:hypothetical protein
MTQSPKLSRLIKPTTDTLFHIDYDWWSREGRDLRAYLFSQIPADVRDTYASPSGDALVDSVDPETGEVKQVDGLLMRARSIAKQRPDFITDHTSIIDAVFRTFLVNDNQPLTVRELSERLNRDPHVVLRTLAGAQVYKGLRPYVERS